MINNKKVMAFIPMRGGSKTVKEKNIFPLGEKPLLAWTIETALNVAEVDRVIVSTDDEKITKLSEYYGAEVYQRPKELATDDSLVIDTIRYMKSLLQSQNNMPDIMLLLEVTSPFREISIIQKCLHRLIDEELDSIATFHAADINPMRTWNITEGVPKPFIEAAIPWLPRQQLPEAYILNGVVYAFRLGKLPSTSPSILFGKMGAEIINGEDVIDIDCERDFMVANAILSNKRKTLPV